MINNIYCIGRNYVEHAKELGNNVEPEPIVFSKPNSSLIKNNIITLPYFSNNIHYETELVVKINKAGYKIQQEEAHSYYNEIAIGLDLTARDLQNKFIEKSLPWFLAKGYKDSCYVSSFVNKSLLQPTINFSMTLNNQECQNGNSDHMIFNINQLIVFLSQYIALEPNDLIYTGTPKGVGQLHHGDHISLFLDHKKMADLTVV